MSRRTEPIETLRRRIAADLDQGTHDYEDHFQVLLRGRRLDCFCVQAPYIRWVPVPADT